MLVWFQKRPRHVCRRQAEHTSHQWLPPRLHPRQRTSTSACFLAEISVRSTQKLFTYTTYSASLLKPVLKNACVWILSGDTVMLCPTINNATWIDPIIVFICMEFWLLCNLFGALDKLCIPFERLTRLRKPADRTFTLYDVLIGYSDPQWRFFLDLIKFFWIPWSWKIFV